MRRITTGMLLFLMTGSTVLAGCQQAPDRQETAQVEAAAAAPDTLVAAAPDSVHQEVIWLEGQTWAEIIELAGQQAQPIFIDFYATWCGPCKRLDKDVYTVPVVVRELDQMVRFKVDVDKPEYAELKKEFSIFNMPTLVLCRSDGVEIDRFLGYRPPDEFLTLVRDYLAGRNTLADMEVRLAAAPSDPDLLLTVGTKRALRLQEEQARPLLERVLTLDPDNAKGLSSEALMQLADLDWKQNRYDSAIASYRRILTDFADPEREKECFSMIAYCYRKKGDMEGMVGSYREMLQRNPEDVAAMNGFAWNASQAGIALEEATDIALKAVTLSDEDAGIMDTLAEVYHVRGMHDEAIDWIRKAIAKEPDDSYLQEQLAKFEKAALEARP